MRINKNKKFLIFGLVFVALFMGVGYSLLSTTLNISSVNRVTGTWDIHIDSNLTNITTTGQGASQSFVTSNDGLSATFAADLYKAGDSVQYQLTVVNNGNVSAKLNDIQTSVVNGSNFVKMSTTAVKDTVINANSSYTFTVTIYVDNPDDLILEDALGISYKLDLYFVQNV